MFSAPTVPLPTSWRSSSKNLFAAKDGLIVKKSRPGLSPDRDFLFQNFNSLAQDVFDSLFHQLDLSHQPGIYSSVRRFNYTVTFFESIVRHDFQNRRPVRQHGLKFRTRHKNQVITVRLDVNRNFFLVANVLYRFPDDGQNDLRNVQKMLRQNQSPS